MEKFSCFEQAVDSMQVSVLQPDPEPEVKILGMNWNAQSGELSLQFATSLPLIKDLFYVSLQIFRSIGAICTFYYQVKNFISAALSGPITLV